jgi:oxepin-CoA hydrolase/3-oxo-5,6-dehydrosuberyl-CoA semialdehyde dehydrogenase
MNIDGRINLLHKLKEDQKPLWGKMSPQHMVEHLYKAVQSSINEIQFKIYTEDNKIPVLKRFLLGNRPLPKEFMNPAIGPDLLPLEFSSLEAAVNELEKVIERYNLFFTENPSAKTAHPTFGLLSKEEWDIFHQKHFTHHLSQYGLIA